MYQSKVILQNPPQLSVIPQPVAQSYVVQPQIISTPQTIAAPAVPQMVVAPQVQSIVPQVQSIVPQVQSIVPQVQVPQAQSVVPAVIPAIPQVMVTPYVLPKGSRMPIAANHQGLIQPYMNFNNIGGSPYGRISMIK